jgi:hypothetical protein
MITASRLKNSAGRSPYGLETEGFDTIEEAGDQAEIWWQSGGTAAVLVLVGETEDARYERAWLDRDRIPDAWVKRKQAQLDKMREHKPLTAPTAVALREAKPTLWEEEEQAPAPQKSAPNRCPCCGADRTEGGHDGDDDPTPSGRLENFRCLKCGALQRPMGKNAIYTQYLGYQQQLSQAHADKVTPWGTRGGG